MRDSPDTVVALSLAISITLSTPLATLAHSDASMLPNTVVDYFFNGFLFNSGFIKSVRQEDSCNYHAGYH